MASNVNGWCGDEKLEPGEECEFNDQCDEGFRCNAICSCVEVNGADDSATVDYKDKTPKEEKGTWEKFKNWFFEGWLGEWMLGKIDYRKDLRDIFKDFITKPSGLIKFIIYLIIGTIAGVFIHSFAWIEKKIFIKINKKTYRIFSCSPFSRGGGRLLLVGIIYAVLMSIPIMNNIIDFITLSIFFPLFTIEPWYAPILGGLGRAVMLALIVGAVPTLIKNFFYYRRFSKNTNQMLEEGAKEAHAKGFQAGLRGEETVPEEVGTKNARQ